MTSPSGLEISTVSSLFLDPFFGAMSFVLERKPVAEERCVSSAGCDLLLIEKARISFKTQTFNFPLTHFMVKVLT
jgi:hypothetical protein